MIPLAFSTNAFKKNTFEEALQSIAAIGYSAVELMADLHHAYPPLMTQQRTAEIQTLLKRLNLAVSNINAFTLFACGAPPFAPGKPPPKTTRTPQNPTTPTHIKDTAKTRAHQPPPPAKAAITSPAIFEAVEKAGSHRPVTVELYPYETTAAGVAKM